VDVVGEDARHRVGADRVRVEPGERQTALGQVAEDVAGEQRGRQQHRRRPDGRGGEHGATADAAGEDVAAQLDPGPQHQRDARVDEHRGQLAAVPVAPEAERGVGEQRVADQDTARPEPAEDHHQGRGQPEQERPPGRVAEPGSPRPPGRRGGVVCRWREVGRTSTGCRPAVCRRSNWRRCALRRRCSRQRLGQRRSVDR
jgi:hypothetical protein